MMRSRYVISVAMIAALASAALPAAAQTAPANALPPAPYAGSFALRSTNAGSAVRAETAYGLNAGTSSTIVQYLTAAYSPVPRLSFFARGGWVDYLPRSGASSTAFTNVAVGGLWTAALSANLRLALSAGSGLPIGQGGGDAPDPGAAAAIAAGNLARSRFEGSSMFSPNHVAPFVGGDIAWISGGFTLQAEASIFQLFRVRGENADPDSTKTSLTVGAHAGYFVIPQLSISAELRDQAFISTPAAVASGKSARSWWTVAGGPRVHIHVGQKVWLRPGLAFVQPLNDPTTAISARSYHVVQLDLPLTF